MKKIVNIIISAAVSLSLLAGYAMPVYSSEDEYQEYDDTFESYDEGSDEDGYEDSFDYEDSDYAVDTEDAYASGDEWDNTDDGEYASDDLTEEDDADYVTDDSDYDVSEANEDEEAETEEPEETDDILEETGPDEETAAEEAGFDAEAVTASSEGEEIPDPDANYTITVGAQSVSGLGASDPDDLFGGYFEQVLYPEKAEMEDGDSLSASEDASYAMSLNQIENAICQNISLAIADVAAGLRASTEFEIPVTEFGLEKTSWTAGELGVSAIIEDNAINPEAVEALAAEIPYSLDRIIKTLLVNHPYELYWYDKTESTISDGYSITAEYDVELGEYVIGVAGSIVISMPVATEYADGTYAVNCEIGQAVQSTVTNAQSVVDSYAGQTDYEKLRGYMETICSLVSYNDNAASNDETPYGNPWQMIWVFDNDPSTSVVCEGYSKAFQYLCDKSNFSSSSVGCICVTGTMAGGTGEGPHMWNIVHMKDGENYLVDVTNCDEGSVGAGGKLFLIGQAEDDEAGSWSAGYTFQFLFDSISYVYDGETLSFYEAQELTLASQDYMEDPDNNDDPDEEGTEIIAEGECGEDVSWKLDSDGLLIISGTGDMWDYTFEATFTKGYRSLISGIIVEDGVTSIGNNAFIECENVNSVTLSESILRIGECAFQSDYTLEKIEIPDSVVIIEDQAFTQCTSLKSIEIGASVSEIGRWVFSHTFELEKISVDENNACYRDLDGVLLNKDGTKLICFPHKYADSYEIQEGIISVGFGAFGYVGTLHNVCFPKTMRVIETAGFLSCELTSVVLYNTIQTIQPDAFASCYALSDVYFYGTEEDWASIDIQNGNTCLSDATIHYLPVDDPGSVMAEGVCGDNLTWQLTSDGILSISGEGDMTDWDENAPWGSFANFIRSIELDEEITRLGDYAFKGCWKVESIRIPDQVQSIGCFCFSECEALKEVDFGEALISIEKNAFSKCHHLTDVIFPDAVTTIEDAAFMDCSRLKTVSFGKDLMSDVVAFSGCSALCRIDVSPDNNRYFSVDGVLFDKDSHFLILYPNKHGENYEIPDGTAGIYDFAFSECMDLISVSIPDTVRSLGFSAFCNCRHLKKIALPEGITTIESFTFLNCFELREISIPESVNTIGTVAFDSCRNLHEIVLPEALSALGPGAFQGCVNLKSVKIPDGISSIPDQLFWMCDSLEEVDLPERLERIGASAFYSCKSLKNITIPEGITTIGEQTFDGCKSLSECSIPEGVLSIGRSAFSKCYNLLELRLPNSLTEIDTYAFSFCQSLKTVQIPVNITSIPEGAFSWCTSLETISFAGDLTNIGDYAFYKCENLLNMNLPPSITYIGKEAFDFVTAVFHVGKNSVADQYLVEIGKTVEYVCDNGHVWSEDYIVDKAATCEETGQESIHCIVCGEIQEGSERAIAKLPHSYGEWSVVRSATCTEAGEEERVCTDCGTKETRVIEATGHVWEEEYKTDKPATSEEEGIESIHCSVCGAVKDGTERTIPKLNPVVDITNAAEVVIADQTYTGSALTPAPKVTVNGTVLVKGTDYTVSYKNNTNVGTAAVTIKGTGGYTGTVTASFAVKAKSLKAAEVAGLTDKTYTGSAFEPQPVVTLGGKTLVLDRDYYLAYKNNTNVGKATLAVKGMGNYSNVAVYYFNIKAASVKNATITGIVSKVITGSALTQTPVVKIGTKTLKLDTDYYLAYKNNINTGKATIAIKGKGNYNNVAVRYFAINPKPSWIASLSSPKTKQIKITWGKRTQISGYQLEISTNKSFAKPKMQKNVYDPAKLSMTVTVAKAKTTYYVRIRSFKKTSDKTYFSTWSAVKTVKTK